MSLNCTFADCIWSDVIPGVARLLELRRGERLLVKLPTQLFLLQVEHALLSVDVHSEIAQEVEA